MQEMMDTQNILHKLFILEGLCLKEGVKADLLILGAAGIALLMEIDDLTFRQTRDIDVNLLDTSDTEAIRKLLFKNGIEIVGGVMELPPMEDLREDNRQLDIGFEALRIFLPSIELFACAKIFSKREKDLDDLENTDLLNACDMEKLMPMVEEYKGYVLNPNDPDINVHQLFAILAKKGI